MTITVTSRAERRRVATPAACLTVALCLLLPSAASSQVASIILTPGSVSLVPGARVQFQVAATFTDGTTGPATVTFSATGGAVAASGLYVAGRTTGRFRLIATYAGGGLADTATVTIVAAGQEPAGCTPVFEEAFSSLAGLGTSIVDGDPLVQASTTLDLTAPQSPAGVLQFSFANGWSTASGHEVTLRRSLGSDYYSLYLSFWFKPGPGWPGPATGPDLGILLGASAGGPEVKLNLGRMAGAALVANLRLSGLARPYQGSTSPLLAGNLGSPPVISGGVWHHVELLLVVNGGQDDGLLEWWFDGVAVGAYAGLGFFPGTTAAIRQIGWSAAPPATPLEGTQVLGMDHWYVSGGRPAAAGAAGSDKVTALGDIAPGVGTNVYAGPTTVLLDARRSEAGGEVCHNDLVAVDGDFRQRRTCARDEIVVFSVEDRPVLDEGACRSGTIWTDDPGQQVTEQLGLPPYKVPVAVWTVNYGLGACQPIPSAKDPAVDIDIANDLFNGHGAGVRFVIAAREDICGNLADRTALGYGTGYPSCDGLQPTLLAHFDPDKINVYYVYQIAGGSNATGIQCRSKDPGIVLISVSNKFGTTLAHELGHTMSLEHTGEDDGIGQNTTYCYTDAAGVPLVGPGNLMWGNGAIKKSLTPGQVFRIAFDEASQLNSRGIRVGVARRCEYPHESGSVNPYRPGDCTPTGFYDQTRVDAVCPAVSHSW